MSWIESHSGLLNHPKLVALAQTMGWDRWHTFGRLHALWHWAIEYAPTGDLHRFNDTQLAAAVELDPAKARIWVEALCHDQSRWIDRGSGANSESIFRVHDWPDYAGKFLKNSRWKDKPEKWKEVEDVYSVELTSKEVVSRNSRVTRGKLFVHNQPTNQPTKPTVRGGKYVFCPASLPASLATPEFISAWESWVEHRIEIHHPLTQKAVDLQMRKLESWGSEKAVESIERSIASAWRDVYEPKGSPNPKQDGPAGFVAREPSDAELDELLGKPGGQP